MTNAPQLDLSYLGNGSIPGVSARLGAALAEAAGVCLESQGHAQGAELRARGDVDRAYEVVWPLVTIQSLRSWGDDREATEDGASGVAVMLVELETPYSAIRRSRTGTGFDYWLGDPSDVTLQRKARMEVSGVRRGDRRRVRARVREKLNQTKASDAEYGDLPAYVIVVEFGTPLAEVRIR